LLLADFGELIGGVTDCDHDQDLPLGPGRALPLG
jgi:hypothetical protein